MNKKIITINSYAKINLSLDVLGKRSDGYHLVDMVMQQVSLHDEVTVRWLPEESSDCDDACYANGERIDVRNDARDIICDEKRGVLESKGDQVRRVDVRNDARDIICDEKRGVLESKGEQVRRVGNNVPSGEDVRDDSYEQAIEIELKTNKRYLPTDRRNIAYKAAELMAKNYAPGSGKIRIDIKKQIPVAAGLAGGSGNGAAVLHALSYLWRLKLPLTTLCALGAELGADVPFCVMGQAGADKRLRVYGEPNQKTGIMADGIYGGANLVPACCARATGTGTELSPLPSVDAWFVLTKPPISVSTAEVYKGIDAEEIIQHPNTAVLIEGIYQKNTEKIAKNMVNVLELFTLKMYPSVMYTKNKVLEHGAPLKVMMSGSGPTIFALYKNKADAEAAFAVLKDKSKETYLTHTVMQK